MSIHKAVIPAAGFGTRMLPAAKAVPKEMLPVLDRPTIQLVVEEAANAGADDVLLVVSRDKKAIEDHFDRHPELEQKLLAGGKQALIESLVRLSHRVRVHSTRQAEQKGLGHAVLQARRHVGGDAFFCLLGDAVFSTPLDRADTPSPCQQLAAAYDRFGTSVIGVEEVDADKVERYGIVGGDWLDDSTLRVTTLVEKPRRDQAPSRLAVAARYVLTPDVFDALDRTPPGTGGEIQLTDALQRLLAAGPVHAVLLRSRRHDIGNPVDWLKTNLTFARHDAALWQQLQPTLRRLLDE